MSNLYLDTSLGGLRPQSPDLKSQHDDPLLETLWRCKNCQDSVRECWAPSPLSSEIVLNSNSLRESFELGCQFCTVIYLGTRHFEAMFRCQDKQTDPGFENITVQYTKNSNLTRDHKLRLEFRGLGMTPIHLHLSTRATVNPVRRFSSSYFSHSHNACVESVKAFLKNCLENHKDCEASISSPLPTRILDLSGDRIQLVDSGNEQNDRYVALSHCWGLMSIATTTTTNVSSRRENIMMSELPKTFQDAVELTRRLDVQYLWIDSLCIIQDSSADWELESGRMASIYKNSYLTIAASRSSDGNGGCFGSLSKAPYTWRTRYGTLLPKSMATFKDIYHKDLWEPFGILEPEEEDSDEPEKHPRTLKKEINKPEKRFWMHILPNHDIIVDNNTTDTRNGASHGLPLLTRAWFMQERLLSPRVLHFGSAELFWECRCGIECECSRGTLEGNESFGARGFYLSVQKRSLSDPFNADCKQAWRMLIEQYSRLNLTRERDRLPALSGIASEQKGNYLAGVILEHFPECLYWSPGMKDYQLNYRPSSYRAPSFSWASLEGPIDYQIRNPRLIAAPGGVHASVVGWSCIPEGLDPRGCVRGGYLEVNGYVAVATATKISSSSTATICVLTAQGMSQEFVLDVPLVLCKSEPAEVAIGDTITLLLLSCDQNPRSITKRFIVVALALRASQRVLGSYERVGLLWDNEPYSEQSLGGFDHFPNHNQSIFATALKWFEAKQTLKIV